MERGIQAFPKYLLVHCIYYHRYFCAHIFLCIAYIFAYIFVHIYFGASHILSHIFLCACILVQITYIIAHNFVRLYFGAYHIYAAAAVEEHKSPISSSFASFASKLFLNLQFPFFCLNLSLQYQGASSIAIKLLCFQVTKFFHNFP